MVEKAIAEVQHSADADKPPPFPLSFFFFLFFFFCLSGCCIFSVTDYRLTAWDDYWQADVLAVPSIVDEEDVWAATLDAAAEHRGEALQVLVREDDARLVDLAIQRCLPFTSREQGQVTAPKEALEALPAAPRSTELLDRRLAQLVSDWMT